MIDKLEVRIERFLRTGEGDFDDITLELYSQQFDKNIPYQSFCRSQGKTPATVSTWSEIPAVPIAAFKSAELVTFPSSQAAAIFHSSGTTQQTRSRHFLKTLTYYETSLASSFQRHALSGRSDLPFLILAPPPGEAPYSSLSWMLEVIKRKWGTSESGYFMQRGQVDEWRLFRVLLEKQATAEPVALLGTTLAFLTLFDQCVKQKRAFHCAPGSFLMDTGGMKTATREVSRDAFLHQVSTYLGIPEAGCLNEYGMCELSSQFYARGASMSFQSPPWVRTQAIDPQSGEALPEGQTGLLRHFDLANVDSVMAVQTEDLGSVLPQGFVFQGRASSAELKGCSLDMEAYLKRA